MQGEGAPTIGPGHAKIVSRERAAAVRAELASRGKRLVHCHGCFDIVHPGHIRHLRQAKNLGDALLVSITPDAEIAKGTGRPLIPEELRAENLAALDCVDLVVIDTEPTALALVEAIRPDVYVKGKEYEFNNDPRFRAEREAVERHGGRVVFSSGDVVFSSTALIAALERSADPFHARLAQLVGDERLQGPALFARLGAIRGQRVVVVGEAILDTYVLCDRPEVAGESPVLTLRPLEARHYDGGAAVVARHAAALGASPVLVTALPDTPEGEAMRRRLEGEGVEVRAIRVRQALPEKQRFLVGAQKVMKVDLVENLVMDATEQDAFRRLAERAAGEGATSAIVTDFGLGLFTPRTLGDLCRALRPRVRVLAGDVSGRRSSLRSMVGMDLVCPSELELRDAMTNHGEGLPLVVWKLLEETGARAAIVTMGADGLIGFSRRADAGVDRAWRSRLAGEHVPALCPYALDPLGCGDALLAAAALMLGAGAEMVQACFVGACAAATQVQRLGNTVVSASDLRQQIVRLHSAHLSYTGPEGARAGDRLQKAS